MMFIAYNNYEKNMPTGTETKTYMDCYSVDCSDCDRVCSLITTDL